MGDGSASSVDPGGTTIEVCPERAQDHDSTEEEMSGGIAVVLGTRPEIIKFASILTELGDQAWVVHTQQHFDPELSQVFIDELGLSEPQFVLDGVGGASRWQQVARIADQTTTIFGEHRPDVVLVQGDTNSTLGGALAAQALGIPVIHVEAGLRSGDRGMPEEINRELVGVLAQLHCAPTPESAHNLLQAGVAPERVVTTGNTVVEATLAALPGEREVGEILERYDLESDQFVLATIHRPSNTDDAAQLEAILRALGRLHTRVAMPLHPRTRARITAFGLDDLLAPLDVMSPIGYRDFVALASRAALIVSDSGGIQEEVTVLKRPLLVLRDSTERPESVRAGFALLVAPAQVRAAAEQILSDLTLGTRLAAIPSPYGDGTASRIIAGHARALAAHPASERSPAVALAA